MNWNRMKRFITYIAKQHTNNKINFSNSWFTDSKRQMVAFFNNPHKQWAVDNMKRWKAKDEWEYRATHKNRNTSPRSNVSTISHTDTGWDGLMDADDNIWEKSYFSSQQALCLSCFVPWMSKHTWLPIHPRLQSVVSQSDFTHPPCVTVLLIITLLFLNRTPFPVSSSHHKEWLKMSCAKTDSGRYCSVVTAARQTVVFFHAISVLFSSVGGCMRECFMYSICMCVGVYRRLL